MANLGCTACCASSRLFGPLDRTTFAGFTLSSFFHFHISLFVGCHALAFRFCDMLQSKLPASYAVGRTELPAAQPAVQAAAWANAANRTDLRGDPFSSGLNLHLSDCRRKVELPCRTHQLRRAASSAVLRLSESVF